jgi:hypothetical protein
MANHSSGTISLTNVIIWGNSAPSDAEIVNSIAETYVSYSLIGGGLTVGCIDGGNNIYTDPMFVNPLLYGDYRLDTGSPAIDAGDNTPIGSGWTDIDGLPRILPTIGTVDMGAYEYEPPPMCSIDPVTLDFGIVPVEGHLDLPFTITNQGGGTLSGTVMGCGFFSIESEDAYALGAGESQVMTVRYAPTASGAHTCDIETGNSSCSDVSCTGGTPPVCALSTTELNFGTIEAGHYQDMLFTITNEGGGILEGTVSWSCPYYTIANMDPSANPYSLTNGQQVEVTVRFSPAVTGGPFTCDIATGCAEVVVCTGICGAGGSDPICEIVPESIDFDTVRVIDYKDTTFTITNVGGGILSGSVLSVSNPHYSILSGGGTYNLASGDFREVEVRFSPQTPGDYKELPISFSNSNTDRLVYAAQGDGGLCIYSARETFPPTRTPISTNITGGTAYDVFVTGYYAYVADGDDGLRIFDVTDPTTTTLTGTFNTNGLAQAVVVVGAYAYVADGDEGLRLIDVNNPATPTEPGFFNTIGYSSDVCVSGDYAYVADHDPGLLILDISDPLPPDSVNVFDSPGQANGVCLLDDYAYVADGASGLRIIDISGIPLSDPLEVGYYDTDGDAQAVAVSGDYAYVADGTEGLQIIDVSDPENPSWVSSFDWSSTDFVEDVAVLGCIVYIADGADNRSIAVDVSDPTDPVYVWLFENYGHAYGIDVRSGGDVLLFGTGADVPPLSEVSPSAFDFGRVEVGSTHNASFTIKNIGAGSIAGIVSETCPDYSILSGDGSYSLSHDDSVNVDFQFIPASSGFSSCLIETGSTLCDRLVLVAGGGDGLRIYNARDPGALIEVGNYPAVDGAMGVYISGNTAYVADRGGDGTSGLVIFDISDPANPDSIGAYHTTGDALNVYVSGDYAYFTLSGGGLKIFDVSDPASPDSVAHWDHLSARDVVVSGGYAYLANGGWGLRIFDVSDPGDPSLISTHDTPGYAQGIFISGDHVFIGDGTSGLGIIDISNPWVPVDAGDYDTPGSARYVCVKGDYAYVADNETGLLIFDVSDPAVPTLVGSYDTPHLAGYVKVSGVNAYVSDTWDGSGVAFHVIDVSEPSNPVLLESTSTHSSNGIALREGGDVACIGYAGYEHAVINAVSDVPDDQGGYVRIDMTRSLYDFIAEKALPLASYQVWRRMDSPSLLQALADAGSERKEVELREVAAAEEDDIRLPDWPLTELNGRYFLPSPASPAADGFPPGTWEFMHSVFATQQENYIINTTTVADSSGAGSNYAVYVITAHTTTPSIWFTSLPDSGYSVDNIAPAPPLGFAVAYNTGSGNELTWDPSPEPDFHYYRIYRGADESFVPGPGNLVHETATESWSDPEYDGWDVYYKIAALDYVGNESGPASPTSTTGDDMPSVPKAFALYQNAPNPFNPTTMIRFDLPRAVHVKLCVYNVKGELVKTLVDKYMTEGRKEVAWTAMSDKGRAVASGIYFYRLVAGDLVQTRKMVLLR